MNVIDLFCGCGGLSLGFQQAGCNVLLGIDNNEAALETFKNNHDNSSVLKGDITQIGKKEIKKIIGNKRIDIIVGGPPCQGMSLSGPRKFDDPRNSLYRSFIRIVEEIRPKAFVIENVPGLVSLYGGQIKNAIIEQFNELGYQVEYQVLTASDYGVPQQRKRVFFVGLQGKAFVFPEPCKTKVTCEMALSDLPPLSDSIGLKIGKYHKNCQNEYQKEMRGRSSEVHNHIAANHSERTKEIISLVPNGGNYKDLPDAYRNTRNFHVAWTRFDRNGPAPTIDTGHRHHFHYEYNRVPTVRECARLQSFPDDFIFLGNKTDQFRQVGNAVPPLLAKEIASALIRQMEE